MLRAVRSRFAGRTLARVGHSHGGGVSHPRRAMAAAEERRPVMGGEDIMKQKEHGTTEKPVQEELRWNVDRQTADRIVSFNRHWAERAGYWETTEFVTFL